MQYLLKKSVQYVLIKHDNATNQLCLQVSKYEIVKPIEFHKDKLYAEMTTAEENKVCEEIFDEAHSDQRDQISQMECQHTKLNPWKEKI